MEQLRSLVEWVESGNLSAPHQYQDEMLSLARQIMGESRGPVDLTHEKNRNLTIIERGARAEYLQLAAQKPLGILLAAFLYGLGAWLIILIIKVQATAVVNAAGWHKVTDLLYH